MYHGKTQDNYMIWAKEEDEEEEQGEDVIN